MAQIDRLFTSIWHNTTTGPGTPLTGLSATITIRDKSTNTIVVNNEAMTEIGLGEYDYTFTTMDATKPYSYVMNPNSTSAYVVTGFVDPRDAYMDKPLSSIIGSFQVNNSSKYDFGIQDRKNIEKMKEIIESIPKEFNETNSHIDVAKTEVINTIDGIELPEVDTTDIIKGIGTIKAQNTKLASYLKGEDDKEKAEMMKMHKNIMEEMEKAYEEMEKENQTIIGEKEKEKAEVMKSADEIIEELEKEVSVAGENAIKEIKTLLK